MQPPCLLFFYLFIHFYLFIYLAQEERLRYRWERAQVTVSPLITPIRHAKIRTIPLQTYTKLHTDVVHTRTTQHRLGSHVACDHVLRGYGVFKGTQYSLKLM